MDVFALLQSAPAAQSKGLIGRQGSAGMRPERRFKPGMDGGLTAALLVSPPLHLRIAVFLSKQPGPPQFTLAWASQWLTLRVALNANIIGLNVIQLLDLQYPTLMGAGHARFRDRGTSHN